MDEFHYSAEAENVLNMFYQAEVMVYVEGEDDICFWETIFNKSSSLKVEVQEVGGCEELKKFATRLIEEDLKVIIACDSDLTSFKNGQISDSRIIKTPGYAIENTFICSNGIYKAIRTLGKIPKKIMDTIDIDSWDKDFHAKLEPLIKLDIYNFINDRGVSVVGDNADRFMTSKKSNVICSDKINTFIAKVEEQLGGVDLTEVETIIATKSINLRSWIRGHFLFSAIHRLISTITEKNGKGISLSYESLYSNLINTFESNFTEQHPEFNYYKNKITAVSL
ncbi:DUF4435 domain-containing protein [Cronobacter sakazakii]|uniref:DUF4435 domain-containing protein n=1 Tax=Cronobacter sakazakii TaxID=28141 RepID=UPI0009754606|nr:DUF4435 domain-containing protein [Cronobacter sakazakii]EGT4448349.1 DUF4435 domain-containing protein [Cronobacter sakazakii]EGT4470595.1 DUF4435 domain-containing protein [Cronobacter sakazakii]ELY2670172.1 DUF4435 domain-containing protein [Cronobacter sakazakii]ELY2789571.1 DUF4435 domain-containing protein [Cronobacter sakazakii]EMC4198814.1 DUF4435 domain-containing protein [Cronobacter sakazakii]